MSKGMRANKPTGEARSARVNTQAKPTSGPLSYATAGQMTMRPQMMGGKSSMNKTVGHYPKSSGKKSGR